jgi:hypothetical protein
LAELYQDAGVSQAWKDEHAKWRGLLNARLNSPAVERNGNVLLTHGELFEMMLHGGRGHHRQADRAFKRYQEFVTDEGHRQLTHSQFLKVVIWIVAYAHNIAVACREELAREDSSATAP